MSKHIILATLAAALMATACTTTDSVTGERVPNRTATGAIIGAIGGAAVGAATNTNQSEQTRKNAIIGAGVGAITGAAVGAYMDEQEKKLREQMRNTGVGVTRTAENEITLNMPSDITFDVDRSDVKPGFQSTIANVAQTLQQYESTTVDVLGHADSTGADAYNQALSERRADSVARLLMANGVQGQRIVAVGFGEQRPIASNDSTSGRAQNRRVEIKLRPVTQN
jgi:outer membrane protein OmpA-like peptidoglycan-associated protein